jgi:hypothetical protein
MLCCTDLVDNSGGVIDAATFNYEWHESLTVQDERDQMPILLPEI